MGLPGGGAGQIDEAGPMLKFVSKALLSVVMDKTARDKLDAHREAKEKLKASTGDAPAKDAAGTAADKAPAANGKKRAAKPDNRPREMTDERKRIIKEALAIQRQKSEIFDALDDDSKAKLLIAAVRAMGLSPAEIERTLKPRKPGIKGPGRA